MGGSPERRGALGRALGGGQGAARRASASLTAVREVKALRDAETEQVKRLTAKLAQAEELAKASAADAARAREEGEQKLAFERERRSIERSAEERMFAEVSLARDEERKNRAAAAAEHRAALAQALSGRDRAHGDAVAALQRQHQRELTRQLEEREIVHARVVEAHVQTVAELRQALEDAPTTASEDAHLAARVLGEQRLEELRVQLQKERDELVVQLKAEAERERRKSESDFEKRLKDLELVVGQRDAHFAAEVAQLKLGHAAEVAAADRAVVMAHLERDNALADLRLSGAAELEETRRAFEQKLTKVKVATRRAVLAEAESERTRAIEELTSQWRSELESERALRGELTRSLASASLPNDDDWELPPEGDEALDARAASLVGIAKARTSEASRLRIELIEAKAEVPELETEIATLRAELASLRAKLANETALSQVTAAQLEEDRRLLDRAERELSDAQKRVSELESRSEPDRTRA